MARALWRGGQGRQMPTLAGLGDGFVARVAQRAVLRNRRGRMRGTTGAVADASKASSPLEG